MEKLVQTIRIRVAGIMVRDKQILLVRHEKNGNAYWLIPGGGMDFGESAEEALVREYQEEVGLDVKVGKLVLVHDSIPPNLHRQVLNLYFLVTAEKFDIRVTQDAVLKDANFYPLSDFPEMKVNPDVKKQIRDGIARDWTGGCLYLGNQWKD